MANDTSVLEDIDQQQSTKAQNDTIWGIASKSFNDYTELIIIDEPPALKYSRPSNQEKSTNMRVIELSDKKTKSDLRREFKVDVYEPEEIHGNCFSQSCRDLHHQCIQKTKSGEIILPKLPAGTVLIKQNTDIDKLQKSPREFCRNVQILAKHTTSLSQPDRNSTPQNRRNPIRGSTKRTFDDGFNRPRLLAMKRRGNHEDTLDKTLKKLMNVPYMNTRSVTKKLYNVGATYQPPTIKDENEWREWPVHGMHERPVYHPQVGLGVEFIGQHFVSWDGGSYQRVSPSPGNATVPDQCQQGQTYLREKRKLNDNEQCGESFENCMHQSLHSVLAYSAQIMAPQFTKLMEDSKDMALQEKYTPNRITEVPKLQATKSLMNLKCIKNHAKLQQVLERGSKNTLILLKTTDPSLKKDNCTMKNTEVQSSAIIPVQIDCDRHNEHFIMKESTSQPPSLDIEIKQNDKKDVSNNATCKPLTQLTHEMNKETVLQELIADTAVLYCTAIGIHQDNLVHYLDNLNTNQCLNWIDTGH